MSLSDSHHAFKNILILGKTWPESSASAAGTRVLDLIHLLTPLSDRLHFASAAQRGAESNDLGSVDCHHIQLNDDSFDAWIADLQPTLVVFDRFMTEEQFGWRVADQCPNAIRVLDTSDFHTLRLARETALKTGKPLDLFTDIGLREFAAIARCDLTLVISPIEKALLIDAFHVAPAQLHWLPFLQTAPDATTLVPYAQRQHMLFVGGYKHAPNVDAVLWLKQAIWPLIRAQLPMVECHIYGPYAPQSMTQLHQPKQGFQICGRVPDIHAVMSQHRINLAPLRYGAGNKGKVIDGWATGTPTVLTPIAAEGMGEQYLDLFPPVEDPIAFASQAVLLYQNAALWQQAQSQGITALQQGTDPMVHGAAFREQLLRLKETLQEHRHHNVIGRLLAQQKYRANEFLSRWITLKNTLT